MQWRWRPEQPVFADAGREWQSGCAAGEPWQSTGSGVSAPGIGDGWQAGEKGEEEQALVWRQGGAVQESLGGGFETQNPAQEPALRHGQGWRLGSGAGLADPDVPVGKEQIDRLVAHGQAKALAGAKAEGLEAVSEFREEGMAEGVEGEYPDHIAIDGLAALAQIMGDAAGGERLAERWLVGQAGPDLQPFARR